MAIQVLSDLDFESTGKVRFEGVIPPATDTEIFIDNITNNRLNTPLGVLRVLDFKFKLFIDSTDELIIDSFDIVSKFKIFRNGSVNKSNIQGSTLIYDNFTWNNDLKAFFPIIDFNTSTGDLKVHVDYTGGFNDYNVDVRLVVDVEYYDYPI